MRIVRLVALLALLTPLWFASPAPAQSVGFVETFDGAPAAPQPFASPRWETLYHLRDEERADPTAVRTVTAQHGADCSAPPATHSATSVGAMIFNCADHMMTAIHGGEYGAIYMQPAALVDFTDGEAVIRWDVSTARQAGRDWWNVTVMPFADQVQMPLTGDLPDLQGQPMNGVEVAMHVGNEAVASGTGFDVLAFRNGSIQTVASSSLVYESFLATSATRRDTFELRISRTHVSFCMPAYGRCFADNAIASLAWTRGVVQISHHSYNPQKDGGQPNTWHWDNVSINPSAPLTLIKTDRAYVTGPTQTVTLAALAPAGSWLRFNAWGHVEISVDGGAWAAARRQPTTLSGGYYHVENAGSYWHPLPEGARSFRLRFSADGWYSQYMHAQDFGIWSEGPTNISTPTPTATDTPVPPTATATATDTPTPIPATATPTPAPRPDCRVQTADAFGNWSDLYYGTLVNGQCVGP